MANNITIKDGGGASVTMKSTDNGGIQTPHHNVDTITTLPSQGFSAAVSFTCGTTAYAAGDVVGASGSNGALQFSSVGPSAGGEVVITSVALEIDTAAVISGETSYRLYFYNVTPPSATNDSSAWDLPSGDRASFLGFVDMGSPADLGSTLYVEQNGINKQIKLASANVFAYLVSNGAYTPTARTFVVTIHTVAL